MTDVLEVLQGSAFVFIIGALVVILGRPLARHGETNLVPIGILLMALGVLSIIIVIVLLVAKVADSV